MASPRAVLAATRTGAVLDFGDIAVKLDAATAGIGPIFHRGVSKVGGVAIADAPRACERPTPRDPVSADALRACE